MNPTDDLGLLTVADVAALLKRPKAFVRSLIREGRLPVVRLGDDPPADPHGKGRRDYRVDRRDLGAFIDARRQRAGAKAPPAPPKPRRKPAAPVARQDWWDGVNRARGWVERDK